jgi:hypothetical protein
MTSIAKSFANIFNQTQDFNMSEFFDNLNSENKDKLFQIVLNSDQIAEILNQNVSEIMCQDKVQVEEVKDVEIVEEEKKVESKSEKIWCESCEKNISKSAISRHNKTKKHLKNIENKNKPEIIEEKKEEEVVDYKFVAMEIRWAIVCSCIPMIKKYTPYELIETDSIYSLVFKHKINKKIFAITADNIKDDKYPSSILKIINGAVSQFIKSKNIKKVLVLADSEDLHWNIHDIKKINCETIRTGDNGLFNIFCLAPYIENFKNKDAWTITGHKYGNVKESIVSFMAEEAFNKSTAIYKSKYNSEFLKNVLNHSF